MHDEHTSFFTSHFSLFQPVCSVFIGGVYARVWELCSLPSVTCSFQTLNVIQGKGLCVDLMISVDVTFKKNVYHRIVGGGGDYKSSLVVFLCQFNECWLKKHPECIGFNCILEDCIFVLHWLMSILK